MGHAPDAQTSITAQYEGDVLLSDYLIFPAQPGPVSPAPPTPPPFMIDTTFYEEPGIACQPTRFLDTLGTWRDLGTDRAGVIPFSYTPNARELVAHSHVVLTVTFLGGSGLPPVVAKSRHKSYQRVVSNFDYLGIGIGVGCKDHLIIVLGDNSQGLKDAIEPLRIWKTLRGLDVYTPVVGVDFPSDPVQIRNYILQHYSPDWETAVLLVGDDNTIPSPDDMDVWNPGFIKYGIHEYDVPESWPLKMGSNTWYGLLQGELDDPCADILVGTLASTNPDTVAGYVAKVMRYERYIDEQWMKKNLLFVLDRWEPAFRECKTTLLDDMQELVPGGISILEADGYLHGNERIVDCLEGNGGVGTVNFFAHGDIGLIQWTNYGTYWYKADADGLNNQSWLPIVYSMACANGFIRNRYGPAEGLAEGWTENPHGGAVGVAANSSFGLGVPTSNQDAWLSKNPYYCLPPDCDRLWVGENFMEAKMLTLEGYRDWEQDYCYYALQWFGDPTVNVWSCYRGGLQLSYSPTAMWRETPTDIQATVKDVQGSPVGGAWVGLYKTGTPEPELLCSTPTNLNGEVLFRHVVVPSEGSILVSAFKDWYRPTEGLIMVRRGPGGGPQGDADEPGALLPREFRLSVRSVQVGDVKAVADAPRPMHLTLSFYDASGRTLAATRELRLSRGSQVLNLSRLCGLRDLARGICFLRYDTGDTCGMLQFSIAR